MGKGHGNSRSFIRKRYILTKLRCPFPAQSHTIVVFPNYITSVGLEVTIFGM
jgi:hypothetical protein